MSVSCVRHADRVAMMYCKSCESPICNACSLTISHYDHDRQDIDDFVQAKRQQLRHRINDVEIYHGQVQDHINTTRRASEQLIGRL